MRPLLSDSLAAAIPTHLRRVDGRHGGGAGGVHGRAGPRKRAARSSRRREGAAAPLLCRPGAVDRRFRGADTSSAVARFPTLSRPGRIERTRSGRRDGRSPAARRDRARPAGVSDGRHAAGGRPSRGNTGGSAPSQGCRPLCRQHAGGGHRMPDHDLLRSGSSRESPDLARGGPPQSPGGTDGLVACRSSAPGDASRGSRAHARNWRALDSRCRRNRGIRVPAHGNGLVSDAGAAPRRYHVHLRADPGHGSAGDRCGSGCVFDDEPTRAADVGGVRDHVRARGVVHRCTLRRRRSPGQAGECASRARHPWLRRAGCGMERDHHAGRVSDGRNRRVPVPTAPVAARRRARGSRASRRAGLRLEHRRRHRGLAGRRLRPASSADGARSLAWHRDPSGRRGSRGVPARSTFDAEAMERRARRARRGDHRRGHGQGTDGGLAALRNRRRPGFATSNAQRRAGRGRTHFGAHCCGTRTDARAASP